MKNKEPKKCSYCGFVTIKYTLQGTGVYCNKCHKKMLNPYPTKKT